MHFLAAFFCAHLQFMLGLVAQQPQLAVLNPCQVFAHIALPHIGGLGVGHCPAGGEDHITVHGAGDIVSVAIFDGVAVFGQIEFHALHRAEDALERPAETPT